LEGIKLLYVFTLNAWKIAVRTAQKRLILKVKIPVGGFFLDLEVSIFVKIFEMYLVTQSL
jgi:hypothetical protein